MLLEFLFYTMIAITPFIILAHLTNVILPDIVKKTGDDKDD